MPEADLGSAVLALRSSLGRQQQDVSAALEVIQGLAQTHELRDFDWVECGLYEGLLLALVHLWGASPREHGGVDEERAWSVWEYCLESPEFSDAAASKEATADWAAQLLDRIIVYATATERVPVTSLRCAKHCFHWLYSKRVDLRAELRKLLGARLLALGGGRGRGRDGGRSRFHVRHLLDVLLAVLSGLSCGDDAPHGCAARRGLLLQVLLPLHAPGEMVEWRDQVPVLQSYHEALVQCVVRLAVRDRDREGGGEGRGDWGQGQSLLTMTILALLKSWPQGFDANTPKEVLLLHEFEALVGLATPAELLLGGAAGVLPALLERVARCIGSDADNIRPAQRALTMFKSPAFLAALQADLPAALARLLPALFRGGALSWNPTINKMTGLALQQLRALDPALFARTADAVLPGAGMSTAGLAGAGAGARAGSGPGQPKRQKPGAEAEAKAPPAPAAHTHIQAQAQAQAQLRAKDGAPPLPPSSSLLASVRAGSGAGAGGGVGGPSFAACGWRPGAGSGPPPVTVTGVAPWAQQGQAKSGGLPAGVHAVMPRPMRPPLRAPPFAPAEAKPGPGVGGGSGSKGRDKGLGSMDVEEDEEDEEDEEEEEEGEGKEGRKDDKRGREDKDNAKGEGMGGASALLEFMQRCLPAAPAAQGPDEDWNQAQAAATPTLLPALRFHDLVFGRVLGEGAFGCVRYARVIRREKTQSSWPEYAVKVVSGERLRALGYHRAVEREMAALSLLSHPGVCRLVSAFRYTGSAYLVLELAARGDLHSYVLALGRGRAGSGLGAGAGAGAGAGTGHLAARFIVGEVAAALLSVHDAGFSFGDLKPENVLLTALGHVKLADFGACRPLDGAAAARLRSSLASVGCLRNGDWREDGAAAVGGGAAVADFPDLSATATAAAAAAAEEKEGGVKEGGEEEERAEGTPGFLPPEVLLGGDSGSSGIGGDGQCSGVPGLGADAWALGCLAYFCLAGRPLFFGSREEVLAQMAGAAAAGSFVPVPASEALQLGSGIGAGKGAAAGRRVNFSENGGGGGGSGGGPLLAALEGDATARGFLQGLLHCDPQERLTVRDAAAHAYLLSGPALGGEDECLPLQPLRLHFGPPPVELPAASGAGGGGGGGGSSEDAQWARRQFSTLWAPMPAEYDLQGGGGGGEGGALLPRRQGPSRTAYGLWPIEETALEAHSPFI